MTNYIAIIIRETIDDPDKAIGQIGMKGYFEDATIVQWNDLARYVEPATGDEWRVVCFAVDVGTVVKRNKNKQDIEDWIQGNLVKKDAVRVLECGMSPSDDLKAAGYEPIQSGSPI